jgi:hypothetical protein
MKQKKKKKKHLYNFLRPLYQLEPPINRLKRAEIQEVINSPNPKKSSGYNLITGKILKGLPIIGIKYLTNFFNTVLFTRYFPAQWKVAQIILKPGNPPNELSYRPITLLPKLSRVFEKLLLKRLLPIVEININTKSSVRLQTKALHNTADTSSRKKDK